MFAPPEAISLIKVHSRQDGVNEITYACEDGTRKTVLEMGAGPTLIQKMWSSLDKTVDQIMDKTTPAEDVARLKIRARAQAEFLALFMTPFFTTTEGISIEARRRYNARLEGDKEYETAGIGLRRYTPPPGSAVRSAPSESHRTTIKNVKKLPPEAIPAIKQALEQKFFTEEQLAKTYGVSVETIREQVAVPVSSEGGE